MCCNTSSGACSVALPTGPAGAATFQADPTNSTSNRGRFTGTLLYTSNSATTGVLTIALHNTNTPAEGGYITGIVFKIPNGNSSGTLTTASPSAFLNTGSEPAGTFGTFEAGAALQANFVDGGPATSGIPAGASGNFTFNVTTDLASTVTSAGFFNYTTVRLVVRFRGYADGASDIVPAFGCTDPPGCPAGSVLAPFSACSPSPCPIPLVGPLTSSTPCLCDSNGDGVLTQNDSLVFVNAYLYGQADLNNDGATNVADFYAYFDCYFSGIPQGCAAVPSVQSICPALTEGRAITLQYTGQDCFAVSHAQGPGSVHCAGSAGNSPLALIRVSDRPDAFDPDAIVWFQDLVSLGGTFEIGGALTRPIGPRTYVHLYSDGQDWLIHTADFDTSCTEPLRTGDSFGAVRIIRVRPKTVAPTLNDDAPASTPIPIR